MLSKTVAAPMCPGPDASTYTSVGIGGLKRMCLGTGHDSISIHHGIISFNWSLSGQNWLGSFEYWRVVNGERRARPTRPNKSDVEYPNRPLIFAAWAGVSVFFVRICRNSFIKSFAFRMGNVAVRWFSWIVISAPKSDNFAVGGCSFPPPAQILVSRIRF